VAPVAYSLVYRDTHPPTRSDGSKLRFCMALLPPPPKSFAKQKAKIKGDSRTGSAMYECVRMQIFFMSRRQRAGTP
jgi:hypothetical protein